MVSEDDFKQIEKMMEENAEFEFSRTKERQIPKFNKLRDERHNQQSALNTAGAHDARKKWALNLSTQQLTLHQQRALEHGFNYATVPNKIAKEGIIAEVQVAQPQERQEKQEQQFEDIGTTRGSKKKKE